MHDIQRVLRLASRRLMVAAFVRNLVIAVSIIAGALLVTRVAERVVGTTWTWASVWQWLVLAGVVSSLLGAILWTVLTRKRGLSVARTVDARASLRESLSTALCVQDRQDAWSQAVVESARERARRVDVRGSIPIEAPKFWPVPIALALATAIVWFTFPSLDLTKTLAKKEEAEAQQEEIRQVSAEVEKAERAIEETLRSHGLDPLQEEPDPTSLESDRAPKSPETVRKAAIKKLTSQAEKLEQMRNGERGQELDQFRKMLRQLKPPGEGPMQELYRNLAKGDMQGARESLQKLQDKMASSDMSPEQREAMKKQLENLGKQMEELGRKQDALQQALQEAGLSEEDAKKAAADPQALKDMLQNQLSNMSEQQKQDLMQKAQSMSQAAESCNNMGQNMQKMAQGMSQSGMNQEGMESMSGLSAELSDLEMLQQEMQGLESAMSQCQGQLARLGEAFSEGQCSGTGQCFGDGPPKIGEWTSGETNRQGNGSGGAGQGNGPSIDDTPSDFVLKNDKANINTQNGQMIGSRKVDGTAILGESFLEASDAIATQAQEATDYIESSVVPREYQDAVKHYFGRLEERVRNEQKQATEAPTQDAEDAGGN